VFSTGDLVRVVVHGDSETDAKELLADLGASEEVGGYLTPVPVLAAGDGGREFGGVELIQEFIVATGAEISAEVIVASVRAFLHRRSSRKEADPKEAVPAVAAGVSVNVLEDGALELRIDVKRPS
jgi:hypothetical protein